MSEFRVFGPPGTGKTTFLREQVTKWARELDPDDIIAASFTRAAAAELAAEDLPIERKQIGTLHSFAYRAIDGPELAFAHVSDWNSDHPEYRLSGHGSDLDDPNAIDGPATEADAMLNDVDNLRARETPAELWPDSLRALDRRWTEWKHAHSLVDFTDMIELALTNTDTAPGDPQVGIFDEVQDFTPLELSLVRRWGRRMSRLVLAGDDDQCIYAFKGATPDAFLDPPVPDDHKRVLSQSYRVPAAVHRVASTWITQLARRETKEYRPRVDADNRTVEGSVSIGRHNYRAPDAIIEAAASHAEDGRTVMLLTSAGYMLDPIKATLRRLGVPFHNPYRTKRGDWNPLRQGTQARRTVVDRVLAYLRLHESTWGADARTWTGQDLKDFVAPLKAAGLLERGYKGQVTALAGSKPVDWEWLLGEAMAPLSYHDGMAMLDGDLDWFEKQLLGTKRKSFEFVLQVARRRGGATLRQPLRICIGTIHSVKGGQADIVYLFPDLAPAGLREWAGDAEDRDSIVRQFYVGMTRAREQLIICEPASPVSLDPHRLTRGAAA